MNAPTTPRPPAGGAGHLHGWFLRGLALAPDATALRVGRTAVSYRELHQRALILAGALLAGADQPPRRVGLLTERGLDGYAGILAAGYAGAAAVPLNPAYPAERTRAMIRAAGLDALLVDPAGSEQLPDLKEELTDVLVLDQPTGPPLAQPRSPHPDETAYILFTSGSTGRPKGVPVRHRNVDAYLRFVHDRYRFTPQDVFSQTFDLTFDLAMFDLFTAWGAGGTLVSLPAQSFLTLPDRLAREGVTVWFSSPSVISLLRRLRALTPGALGGLRLSLFCGEPLLRHDAADWQAAAPASRLENLYGPTELTISCTVHRWDPATSPDACVHDIVPIGTPHPGLRVLLADEGGRPVPETPDATGELCVTGDQLFPGYLDPADDRGRFLEHAGARWYRTGDLVRRLPDGELAYLGRRDHQVKINGIRVELAEVETALRRLPGVTDAVVVAVDGQLFAYYLGRPRPAPELMEELGALLPRQLIPLGYRHLDAFPLNANRKTDRPALAAEAAGPRGGRRQPPATTTQEEKTS
ncbi:amino acid adenylation domain-containing protein [Streptomyces sp. DSM 44915]|uniref:Amino acid adenylation domain-containing protein n=1 Tax=Streptomyces chisholmiae TaxID=3075540 RepID=A0ABU2JQW0_9ACTN|nr:amino acid adenylation domain-containing protein [Streptomyces sp. DSM 44915]MDT0267377.1 amino acid adenylation domain-containing protein [Streptomyces sp. DSM 44915]